MINKNTIIIFDVDGTVTEQRRPLTKEMKDLLLKLSLEYKIAFLGGGNYRRLYNQLDGIQLLVAGNYGLEVGINGKIISKDIVCSWSKGMLRHMGVVCDYIREDYGYTDIIGESFEVHPSGMVTLPLLGTKAPQELKDIFDMDKKKRKIVLPELQELLPEFNVIIGGTNSFDILPLGIDKCHGVTVVQSYLGLHDIFYVGNDFEEGCNDNAIAKKGLPYLNVTSIMVTKNFIKFLLGG